jgi:hypothetical protein
MADLHRIVGALKGQLPDRAYIEHGRSHLYERIDDQRVNTTRGASAYLKLAEGCPHLYVLHHPVHPR